MSRWQQSLILAWVVLCGGVIAAGAASIKKVLPHYLDDKRRHTHSPSLYERDAYQAYLRSHPEEQSTIRFDTLFKAAASTNLSLRIELRGTRDNRPTRVADQTPVFSHRGGRSWRGITLREEDFRHLGKIVAWRATLWEGGECIAEQRSFLW